MKEELLMMVINLKGGLGNQLFQYAFVRSLSLDLDADIFFDLAHYDSEYAKSLKHDKYTLHHFRIPEDYQKFSHEYDLPAPSVNYNELSFNEITGFPSQRNFNELKLPARFDGYWQSEKYFMHHKEIIRDDLQFKAPLKGKNKEVAQEISDHNSVAVHIRRGDYLDYTKFGTCSREYYKKSVKFIENHVEDPKFFIFSDDPEWVKENINIDHPHHYVTHNDVTQGHEDMRLMSLCQHFIIANSSFSWWGAWLSNNTDKIVTIPRPWFICRHPILQNIDNGKNYHPIVNDLSNEFNESNRVLFSLNTRNFSPDFSSIHHTNLNFDKDMLNVKADSDSRLYLKEIKRQNEDNDAILKISLQAKKDGVWRLYYKTRKTSNYTNFNKAYSYYYEQDDVDIYVFLSRDISLSDLRLDPSAKGESEINIKELEIREISDSKNDYGKSGSLNKLVTRFQKILK